jgi:regulator of protease activity HflC (stomatin/prohibitin superfamily)
MRNAKLLILIPGCLIALFIFSMAMGTWYTIDQGERGVQLRNGKVIGVSEPGLSFKLPLVESVQKISIQNHSAVYESLAAYSRDQQTATMRISVSYHIPAGQVVQLYTEYGSIDNMISRLLNRNVPQEVENVFGKYTAISAVQDREKMVFDLSTALKANISGPIIIDGVQVENIDFSDAYEQSVENRMKAEVAIATRTQNLETEKINAQIKVTQAQAEADSSIAKAKAEAEATRLTGAAEAEAIKLRGDALRQNPSLVALTTAERWNGALPSTMIPGGSVPFISTNGSKADK